jgi:hypothetical protein
MIKDKPFKLVISGDVDNVAVLPPKNKYDIKGFCIANGVQVEYSNDAEQAGKLKLAVTGDNLTSEQMQQAKAFGNQLSRQEAVNNLPGDNWHNIAIQHDLKPQKTTMLQQVKEIAQNIQTVFEYAKLPEGTQYEIDRTTETMEQVRAVMANLTMQERGQANGKVVNGLERALIADAKQQRGRER